MSEGRLPLDLWLPLDTRTPGGSGRPCLHLITLCKPRAVFSWSEKNYIPCLELVIPGGSPQEQPGQQSAGVGRVTCLPRAEPHKDKRRKGQPAPVGGLGEQELGLKSRAVMTAATYEVPCAGTVKKFFLLPSVPTRKML